MCVSFCCIVQCITDMIYLSSLWFLYMLAWVVSADVKSLWIPQPRRSRSHTHTVYELFVNRLVLKLLPEYNFVSPCFLVNRAVRGCLVLQRKIILILRTPPVPRRSGEAPKVHTGICRSNRLHLTRNHTPTKSWLVYDPQVPGRSILIQCFVRLRRVEARDIHTQRQFGRQQVRSRSPRSVPRFDPCLELRLLPPSDSASRLGGWWSRPSNWKANTAIAFAGIIGVTYGVWNFSADKEVHFSLSFPPFHPVTVYVVVTFGASLRKLTS